ncbi:MULTISPECIES: hypothetical protein [Campylobacter]|uniref:hypothetical protein n=1 Tax=Campylobacter TaxID=194 RepID=UPI000A335FD7|nr:MULTISPECIES: hypothetical protein [Campylobacter]MCI5539494.1 hypothetical protein [Campylobacter lanienae]MCR8678431.1 hypothetical protein [Campylobacter sp. RM19072]MDD7513636.1 hypothetical protein [Campylobacter lanienae]MDY5519942.1 hypothetical protein [Campylobacter lanienae]
MNDKAKRVKYLRGLEKFAILAIKSLKRDDYDPIKFRSLIDKNAQILSKIEPVYLDQPYSKSLCEFVNLVINNDDKTTLLKAANSLDKLKNSKTYKKDKHKGQIYE